MNPEHPWMWMPWGGMWIFPMIAIVILIVFLLLFFGRAGCRPPWGGPGGHHREEGAPETALDILKKRYAKGEITKEEFDKMKKDILE